ncbi:glycosyltransferase family 90 protein [Xylariaceae sp. AK1471]|nr:glycosyltransferase family 90 protein [Xylariaceae sp. AK1471]
MSQAWKPEIAGRQQKFERQSTTQTRNPVDPITWSTGAALACGALTHYLASRQTELASELLCWVLLPVVFSIAKQHLDADKHAKGLPLVNKLSQSRVNGTTSTVSLWLVAISIATCSLFRAEIGVVVLFPALTPLLLIGQRYLRPDIYPPAGFHTSLFSRLTHTILGTTLTAIFAVVALSEWDPLGYAISAVPVAALFVTYTLLTPRTVKHPQWLKSSDIEATLRPLCLRVVILLVIILGGESVVVGFPNSNVKETLTLSLAKALTWYFTSQVARHSSWVAATVTGTFSLLATRNPFAQQTDTRALVNVIASFLALGQAVNLLPKQTRARSTLWALALVPLLPYFANLVAINLSQSSAVVHVEKHPVQILIHEAKAGFDTLLRNQSDSYSAAYNEYQRRYGFEPPYGFEDWYKFARSHQSPIIDEFDMIFSSISPFLRISGKEVLEIMSQVYTEPDHELWSCAISGHPAKTRCSHPWRINDRHVGRFFDRLIEQLPGPPLEVKFLINHLDEPTVLIPPPSQKASKLNVTTLGRQRAWEALTKFCSSRKSTASMERKPLIETYDLPFVTNRNSAIGLCEHAEYSEMHGFLLAPESLRLIEGLVPVLSTGAPSTMGDILYPSAAYVEERQFKYDGTNDVDWDEKQNNLYWAGSTTGGHARDERWHGFHRQRFVELAQNLKSRSYSYLREKDGVVSRVASSFLNSRLYDVAFAKIFQCETRFCREQRAYFKAKPWVNGDRPLRSRLVFDLDGNGVSGRYYKFLASKSAPLKQTIFREWHDERLVPWVHYIPVSESMEELPELVFHLTSTESGQKGAREIAEQGRLWFSKAFREVDMAIYVYRLLLELARLQDPDRPAWQIDIE